MRHVWAHENRGFNIRRRSIFPKNSRGRRRPCQSWQVKKEDHPPCHPNPRRSALTSMRETIQYIRVMRRPVKKGHACCMDPVTLQKIAKPLMNTPRSAPHIIHTRTKELAPAATTGGPRTSISMERRKRLTPWNLMMSPSQKRRRDKKEEND